jgi:DNA-binding beta-propeller fold protein YncE
MPSRALDQSPTRNHSPAGVAVDRAGNLYIADADNERIRKISPEGIITTVVGLGREMGDGGLATNAAFTFPAGVTVDAAGNLYILEVINHRVRKVSRATGVITTREVRSVRADVARVGPFWNER